MRKKVPDKRVFFSCNPKFWPIRSDLCVESITTWHPDFKSLRRSIRGVGANHLAAGAAAPISRQARSRLIEAYEGLRTETGLPLTYEVLLIHARKCRTPS